MDGKDHFCRMYVILQREDEKQNEKQGELRKYMDAVEEIETLRERMTFSAQTRQNFLFQYAFTAEPADDQPESAGHPL